MSVSCPMSTSLTRCSLSALTVLRAMCALLKASKTATRITGISAPTDKISSDVREAPTPSVQMLIPSNTV